MRRFCAPVLLIVVLGLCTLNSIKGDDDKDRNDNGCGNDDRDNDDKHDKSDDKGKHCGGKNHQGKTEENKPKNKCKEKSGNNCGGGRRPCEDRPTTRDCTAFRLLNLQLLCKTAAPVPDQPLNCCCSPPSSNMPTPTRTPTGTSTRTLIGTSTTTLNSRTLIGTSTRTPTGTPIGTSSRTDMVAIFVPLSILLLLLVLLAAVILWRHSDQYRHGKRLGGEGVDVLKAKTGSNVVTIYAMASHPRGSGNPVQLPQSAHIYQEISDACEQAPGKDSAYSTVGLPYQEQKAADQQPAEGQYSQLGLPTK